MPYHKVAIPLIQYLTTHNIPLSHQITTFNHHPLKVLTYLYDNVAPRALAVSRQGWAIS